MFVIDSFKFKKKKPPFIFSVTVAAGQTFTLPLVSGGEYNCSVDWGDETVSSITAHDDAAKTHTYTDAGTYDISIAGVLDGWRVGNYSDRLKITEVKQWGILKFGIGVSAFLGCSNMTISATDILDTSECISLQQAFFGCVSISTIPNIGQWNVSNIKNLSYCFSGMILFNDNLSTWDVSNVESFGGAANNSGMFYNCSSFNQDLSAWDVSSATSFSAFFNGCSSFNQNVPAWWDLPATVTRMNYMFAGTQFNYPVSGWDVSNVVYIDGMFSNTPFNQDVSGWNVSNVISMAALFQGTPFNLNISGWDVSSVENMSFMFDGSLFNQDISGWNVSSVITMRTMFQNSPFNQNISGWSTGNVTDMHRLVERAYDFDQNLGGWDVTSLTDAQRMFLDIEISVANYDALLIGWAAQAVNSGVPFNGGNNKYTGGGAAEAARNTLINTYGWVIIDGGAV